MTPEELAKQIVEQLNAQNKSQTRFQIFLEKFKDKVNEAIAHLIVFGGAGLVGWAIITAYVGDAKIDKKLTDEHNKTVERESEIIGSITKLQKELSNNSDNNKTIKEQLEMLNKKITAGQLIPPTLPPMPDIPELQPMPKMNAQRPEPPELNPAQQSLDFLIKHREYNTLKKE